MSTRRAGFGGSAKCPVSDQLQLRPSSGSVKSRASQPGVLGDTGQGETEQQGTERGHEEPRFEPSEKPLLGTERRRPGRPGGKVPSQESAALRGAARVSGGLDRESPDWSGEGLLKWRPTVAGTTAGQRPWQGRKPSGQRMGGGQRRAHARSRQGLCSQALKAIGRRLQETQGQESSDTG